MMKIKKILSLLTALTMSISMFAVFATTSHASGEPVVTLTNNGLQDWFGDGDKYLKITVNYSDFTGFVPYSSSGIGVNKKETVTGLQDFEVILDYDSSVLTYAAAFNADNSDGSTAEPLMNFLAGGKDSYKTSASGLVGTVYFIVDDETKTTDITVKEAVFTVATVVQSVGDLISYKTANGTMVSVKCTFGEAEGDELTATLTAAKGTGGVYYNAKATAAEGDELKIVTTTIVAGDHTFVAPIDFGNMQVKGSVDYYIAIAGAPGGTEFEGVLYAESVAGEKVTTDPVAVTQ